MPDRGVGEIERFAIRACTCGAIHNRPDGAGCPVCGSAAADAFDSVRFSDHEQVVAEKDQWIARAEEEIRKYEAALDRVEEGSAEKQKRIEELEQAACECECCGAPLGANLCAGCRAADDTALKEEGSGG